MAVQLCDSYAGIEFTGTAGLHERASGSRPDRIMNCPEGTSMR